MATLHARPEAPLHDGFDGLFVQPEAERANHFDVARHSGGIHHDGKQYGPGVLRFTGFFRIFRLDFVHQDGRGHLATNTVDAPTRTVTATGAEAIAIAAAKSAAMAAT